MVPLFHMADKFCLFENKLQEKTTLVNFREISRQDFRESFCHFRISSKAFSRKCENETFRYHPRFNSKIKICTEKSSWFIFHCFVLTNEKYISCIAQLFINISSAFEELIPVQVCHCPLFNYFVGEIHCMVNWHKGI
jgi:hypothetical protein